MFSLPSYLFEINRELEKKVVSSFSSQHNVLDVIKIYNMLNNLSTLYPTHILGTLLQEKFLFRKLMKI